MKNKFVVAIGGNAISKKGHDSYSDQAKSVKKIAKNLFDMVADSNNEVVLIHGNGPQIGNILIQNELANDEVPEMPMSVCGAMTEGQIGYLLQMAFYRLFFKNKIAKDITAMISIVEVDGRDKAFKNPSKPVGPFYSFDESRRIAMHNPTHVLKEDSGRGWRRMVASPSPLKIFGLKVIKKMVSSGALVIAGGGGGIPVIQKNGAICGADAVIDKDKTGALMANELNVSTFIILTGAEKVIVGFGTLHSIAVDKLTVGEAENLLENDVFAEGSMKPKIEAAVDFVKRNKKRKALITNPEKLNQALSMKNGTWIVN